MPSKEKPILFSCPMVRAILEGCKTQTRRLIKPAKSQDWLTAEVLGEVVQMVDRGDGWWAMSVDDRQPGPHGTCPGHIGSVRAPYQVGDILWVRETMKRGVVGWEYAADGSLVRLDLEHQTEMLAWAHHKKQDHCVSIHMPRWASRITLEVTEVRAQRLNDISEEDAKAEGCQPWQYDPMQPMTTGEMGAAAPYRGGYACLWDEINEERATWKSNPWVWAYTFKRLESK